MHPSNGAPVVHLQDVVKTYPGQNPVPALRGVSLSLGAGELVVILGPSGSGKTTLLNLIGGLETPSSGRVTVAGYELNGRSEASMTEFRRSVIGFVFQFYNLMPTLTARENVELVAALASDPLDPAELLELVGLGARQDHFPSALSGGESQRVAIARALVKRPSLVLADEPTGALDFETAIRVLDVLRAAMTRVGCTVVLVTHNQEIARMADRVVHIAQGQIASDTWNEEPVKATDLRW